MKSFCVTCSNNKLTGNDKVLKFSRYKSHVLLLKLLSSRIINCQVIFMNTQKFEMHYASSSFLNLVWFFIIRKSFSFYIGQSNQRRTKAVSLRPFDLQPCTWCLLKLTLGLFSGPKSQIDSSYHKN